LVGLICWILIIGGFGGLALALKATGADTFAHSLEGFPYPPWVAEIFMFGLRALMVIVGILMYERQGWARYLYIVLMPPFFMHQYFVLALTVTHTAPEAQKLALHRYALDAGVVLYLVSIVILFLRPVRRYYHPPLYIDE